MGHNVAAPGLGDGQLRASLPLDLDLATSARICPCHVPLGLLGARSSGGAVAQGGSQQVPVLSAYLSKVSVSGTSYLCT